jgi:molybdate transport system substrate-binding protein
MRKLLLILVLLFATAAACAQEITVAAAADLSSVFPEVAARFEKQTGRHVRVNFGSSGQFLLQIENGAPFDIFFSADVQYPKKLEAEGLTVPGTLYSYAVGRLVLWVPNGSPLDLSKGLHALLDPAAKRIALANPAHAPYGRAAVEALKKEGLYDALQPKFVLGENISQAAQFVQSGNAEAGLVALSLALSPQMKAAGHYVELPATDYPAMEQAAVVLKSARDKQAAAEFIEFLRRSEIVALMEQYGFTLPRAK